MKKEKNVQEGKKTWSNYYWYYYKWHMAFIIMIIIAIVICTVQCANKKEPDYYIVFYSDSYADSELLDKLANKAEKFATDRNEDGEVYIQALNCSFYPSDPNLRLTANQQANAQIQNKEAVIWILDDAGIEQFYSEHNLDIFGTSDSLPDYDSHALYAKDSKLSGIIEKVGNDEEYYIFFRYRNGADEYNEMGEKIITSLIK